MVATEAEAQPTVFFQANSTKTWLNTVNIYRNATFNVKDGTVEMNHYVSAQVGRMMYKKPVVMLNNTARTAASFNTAFVFSMTKKVDNFYGDGLCFVLCPTRNTSDDNRVSAGGYLGMFNATTVGRLNNSIFAVELDTHKNGPFSDPNDNHVGVDVNSVQSVRTNDLVETGIRLNSGKKIGCWIDYDGKKGYLWVYLSYLPSPKPRLPLIAMSLNLTPIIRSTMYVGFTASTGTRSEFHTIYSWWFRAGYRANISATPLFAGILPPAPPPPPRPPRPPPPPPAPNRSRSIAAASLSVSFLFLLLASLAARRYFYFKQSLLLSRLFLPLVCWLYWKKSAPDPSIASSERCLRLSLPPSELFAWFWRRRRRRRRRHPGGGDSALRLRLYPHRPPLQFVLKRKFGQHFRGEAWHEGRLMKRRRSLCRSGNHRFLNTGLQSCMSTTGVTDEKEPLMRDAVPSDYYVQDSPIVSRADRNHRAVRFQARPGSIDTAPPSPDVHSAGIMLGNGKRVARFAEGDDDGDDFRGRRPPNFGAGGPRKSLWLASYAERKHSVEVDAGFFEEDDDFQKRYAKICRRRSVLIPQIEGGFEGQTSIALLKDGGADTPAPPEVGKSRDSGGVWNQRRRMSISIRPQEGVVEAAATGKKMTEPIPFTGMMDREQQRRRSINLTGPSLVSGLTERQQQRRRSINMAEPVTAAESGFAERQQQRRRSINLAEPVTAAESGFAERQQQRRMSINARPTTTTEDRKKKKKKQVTLHMPEEEDMEEAAATPTPGRRRSFIIVEPNERETVIPSPRPTEERGMSSSTESHRATAHTWHFDS